MTIFINSSKISFVFFRKLMLERRWRIDLEIGKTGAEEVKWEFSNPIQKRWVPKLRLWYGDRDI